MIPTCHEQKIGQIEGWLKDPKILPPMPSIVQEAVALLENADTGAVEIARVISKDEVVTAKILRIVNSAFYGLPRRVSTMSQAIPLLGFQQVRLLLLGVSLFQSGGMRDPRTAANREMVWQHSLTCAQWGQAFARHLKYEPAEEAFLAALLHDVGKVLLAVVAPTQFNASVEMSKRESVPSYDAELQQFGIDHRDTGSMICAKWNFPPMYQDCIHLHHSQSVTVADFSSNEIIRTRQLLYIVRAANSASHLFDKEAIPYESSSSKGARGSLDPETLDKLIKQMESVPLEETREGKHEH